MYVYMYVYACICMYVCVCVFVCICVYIYGGPNAAQSGNEAEGRDHEDHQVEDDKTT